MRATAYAPTMQSNASKPSPTGGKTIPPGGGFPGKLLGAKGFIGDITVPASKATLKLSAVARPEMLLEADTRPIEKPEAEADDEAEV